MDCNIAGFTILHYLPDFDQTHVHWVSDVMQPFHPLWPSSPPALNLSYHQCLSQWAHSLHQFFSHEYGLIFFRIDWFDLLAAQRTLKTLLHHHSLKVSILWHSAFFMVQLSHPYIWCMYTYDVWCMYGKTIAFTRQTFVSKIISLLFNMLSMFVIAFLPRSKRLLISCLQSPSAVILAPKKVKSVTVSIVSPSICHEVMGPDVKIFVFWMLSFKPAFSLSLSSRGSLVSLCFLP